MSLLAFLLPPSLLVLSLVSAEFSPAAGSDKPAADHQQGGPAEGHQAPGGEGEVPVRQGRGEHHAQLLPR